MRHRGLSHKTFFMKAIEVYAEVAKIAHNEKVVPKRYRFTFGVPMCETALSIVQNIERGDAFYPNTSWGVIERKKYMALAMADANSLADMLTCLIEVRGGPRKNESENDESAQTKRDGVGVGYLEGLLDLINEEIGLLQSAKNGVRLIGKTSDEEKLQAAEKEAERLRNIITMRGEEWQKSSEENAQEQLDLITIRAGVRI